MENHEVMAEIDEVLRAINKANGLLESWSDECYLQQVYIVM